MFLSPGFRGALCAAEAWLFFARSSLSTSTNFMVLSYFISCIIAILVCGFCISYFASFVIMLILNIM